ncbi:hypothetical protein MFAL_40190 [Mycolicibacterium fallax]|nr:hypothetical protein MFAL_40190 [Mycolicibacterium fallax]
MTDTDLIPANDAPAPASSGKLSSALSSMLLPELRTLAGQVGVKGASGCARAI